MYMFILRDNDHNSKREQIKFTLRAIKEYHGVKRVNQQTEYEGTNFERPLDHKYNEQSFITFIVYCAVVGVFVAFMGIDYKWDIVGRVETRLKGWRKGKAEQTREESSQK